MFPAPLGSSGRLFQQLGAQWLEAEPPDVLVLLCGTARREEPDDLRGPPGS